MNTSHISCNIYSLNLLQQHHSAELAPQSDRKEKCFCRNRFGSRASKLLDQGAQVLFHTYELFADSLPQKIYKADGDAHSWEWLAMVSPCVDVLRNLVSCMNDDLGTHQGKKHSSPDIKKDIDILMASLTKLEVYVEKEGRILDPDEMPVPDVILIGLTDLAHSSVLSDFNAQFERNHERWRLLPISALIKHLDKPDTSPQSSPLHTTQSIDISDAASVPSPEPNGTTQIPFLPMPTPQDDTDVQHIEIHDSTDSSNSDEGDYAKGDDVTTDDFKPKSLSLETEADIAMDMDSVTQYFEDDVYPWEDKFEEYGSESGASTDKDEVDYKSS